MDAKRCFEQKLLSTLQELVYNVFLNLTPRILAPPACAQLRLQMDLGSFTRRPVTYSPGSRAAS